MVSVPPPAADGTMSVTDRTGYSWACSASGRMKPMVATIAASAAPNGVIVTMSSQGSFRKHIGADREGPCRVFNSGLVPLRTRAPQQRRILIRSPGELREVQEHVENMRTF